MLLNFISALAPAKKAFEKIQTQISEDPNRHKRIQQAFANALAGLQFEMLEADALDLKTSQEFCKKYFWEPLSSYFLSELDYSEVRKPIGLISIILPLPYGTRFAIESAFKALIHGNVVFVKTSTRASQSYLFLKLFFSKIQEELSDELLPKEAIHLFFGGGEELATLMATHPSISSVVFAGKLSTAESLYRHPQLQFKKTHFRHGHNNSLCVLDEVHLEEAAQVLVDSIVFGAGQMPYSPTRVYVLETFQKKFEEIMLELFSRKGLEISALYSEPHKERVSQIFSDILKTEGKSLFYDPKINDGNRVSPLIVRDLSHCSVYQQDELSGPLLLISPVKYQHEIIRWMNTGYYAGVAYVFGDREKAIKFSAKLNVGLIVINAGPESFRELPVGLKQSVSGISDFGLDSEIFSVRKAIL